MAQRASKYCLWYVIITVLTSVSLAIVTTIFPYRNLNHYQLLLPIATNVVYCILLAQDMKKQGRTDVVALFITLLLGIWVPLIYLFRSEGYMKYIATIFVFQLLLFVNQFANVLSVPLQQVTIFLGGVAVALIMLADAQKNNLKMDGDLIMICLMALLSYSHLFIVMFFFAMLKHKEEGIGDGCRIMRPYLILMMVVTVENFAGRMVSVFHPAPWDTTLMALVSIGTYVLFSIVALVMLLTDSHYRQLPKRGWLFAAAFLTQGAMSAAIHRCYLEQQSDKASLQER